MATTFELTGEDHDLIAAFAGCSLDESPGKNWVQDVGGLPEYVCVVAKAIKKTGKSTSQAIAIAISRIKKWATGAGVDKDTQAKAAKALAEWESKKTKSHAKSDGKKVAASNYDVSDTDLLRMVAFTLKCEFSAIDQITMTTFPTPGESALKQILRGI